MVGALIDNRLPARYSRRVAAAYVYSVAGVSCQHLVTGQGRATEATQRQLRRIRSVRSKEADP